jgi:NAD(P)-dependent dehydrogenase (short-subunit alcohol dehydrogenase family)
MRLKNRTAVVTGAAGGIGRAIAVSLSRRGCHLALADVHDPNAIDALRFVVVLGFAWSAIAKPRRRRTE